MSAAEDSAEELSDEEVDELLDAADNEIAQFCRSLNSATFTSDAEPVTPLRLLEAISDHHRQTIGRIENLEVQVEGALSPREPSIEALIEAPQTGLVQEVPSFEQAAALLVQSASFDDQMAGEEQAFEALQTEQQDCVEDNLRALRDRREEDHWEMERLKLEVAELANQLNASRRNVDEAAELHQELQKVRRENRLLRQSKQSEGCAEAAPAPATPQPVPSSAEHPVFSPANGFEHPVFSPANGFEHDRDTAIFSPDPAPRPAPESGSQGMLPHGSCAIGEDRTIELHSGSIEATQVLRMTYSSGANVTILDLPFFAWQRFEELLSDLISSYISGQNRGKKSSKGFTLKKHSYFFNMRANARGAFIKIVGESWEGMKVKGAKASSNKKRQICVPEENWVDFSDLLNSAISTIRTSRIDLITGELQRLIEGSPAADFSCELGFEGLNI